MSSVDLTGKNILVTGGSLGIGFACARACLEAGGRVAICARDKDGVERAVRDLAEIAGAKNVAGLSADVTVEDRVRAAFDLVESFGPLTSVVHAAAVLGPSGDVTVQEAGEWFETVRINLFGAFLVAREACRRMKRSGGRIVLFSGGGGGSALPKFTPYASSKAAVVRFAETVAQEMAPFGIAINALAPGLVATRMLAQFSAQGNAIAGSAGSAEPAARGAAFLISDAADGISGRFVAAQYDGFANWPDHLQEISGSDLFTLRRIVPRDRGLDWQ